MKFIIIALITASFSLMASAGECFNLDTGSPSEASKVCFSASQAEVYTSEDFLMDTIKLSSSVSYANLGHGVVWKFTVSSGKSESFSVKATRNSGGGFTLNYLRNLKTDQLSREYVPVRYPNGGQHNVCNGRGRCI